MQSINLNLDLDLTARCRDPGAFSVHCCCGNPECAMLKHNCSVLETVEKDVQTAAQLGQALLARHEAYMADAERDRLELTSRIERLEMDKHELEAVNASKIEENRNLLDQLELLNSTVSESDTKIKSLEASLLSSQQAVRRLESAAARAEDAERHLASLEEEQMRLHTDLITTQEDARSHAQRCKEAQRGILDMQDQLERMEKEARLERERHAEVIDRMERQREVEKQLDTAAGRLKGAAATKSLGLQKNGTQVVGHFVRDLLQDNANLQLGIAELRELLMNANDEVQTLREQLTYHSPTASQSYIPTTLKSELEGQSSQGAKISQELHVHHHYHVTPKQESRKPKKKRLGLTPGVFAGPALASLPTTAAGGQWGTASSPSAPSQLSQNMYDARDPGVPLPSKAWGALSNAASDFASSAPSSPQSKRASLFDGSILDTGLPPTSPTTSYDPMSPTWRPMHSKRPSVASYQSIQSIQSVQAIPHLDVVPDTPPGGTVHQHTYYDDTIHEEDEESMPVGEYAPSLVAHEASTEDSVTGESDLSKDDFMPRHGLRRAMSHESIMSLTGGLDIHTLKARPSQMTLRPLGGLEAVVTGITAQPTLSRGSSKRSDLTLRDHFAGYQSPRSVSGSATDSPLSSSVASQTTIGGIGRLVGWRPWANSSNNRARSTSRTPSERESMKDSRRAPGINQPGAIPGFQEYWGSQRRKGAPAKVNPENIDHEALNEVLEG